MRFGLYAINYGTCADPDSLVRVARHAEAAGLDSLWAGEHIEAMRALWTMAAPEFHGRHVDFAGIDAHPRPVQPDGPPILIGGNSAMARRRAVTTARGWIPADFDLDATREARRALDRDLQALERPTSLGPFDFTVISPTNRLDRRLVDGYRDLGVDQLIVLPGLDVPTERRYHAVPIDEIFRSVDHLAELAAD